MKAKLQIITAMALFGTLSVFIRNIPLPSSVVALCRAWMALIALLAAQSARGRLPDPRTMGRELILLCLSGAAMGFNWIFLFEAYKYTTVSVATLSYYFAPVLVTLACPVLFR
ncbi:MAG: EamA family transporter, partial [bacterium]